MIWILLLVGFTSSVCGLVVKRSLFEAQEDANVTLGWDVRSSADMSLANLVCFFHSAPMRVFFRMLQGVEVPESQHQQFAGRVRCDRGALRAGRVRLHVFGVTAADSGSYRCDVAAGYDPTRRTWALLSTERFVLNVTPAEQSSDAAPTPAEGDKRPPGGPAEEEVASTDWNRVKVILGGLNVGFALLGVALIIVFKIVALVEDFSGSLQVDP